MKIFCMDCLSEDHSNLESLKANRHFRCARCAEQLRQNSEDGAVEGEEFMPFDAPEEFYSNPLDEAPLWPGHGMDDDILEVSDESLNPPVRDENSVFPLEFGSRASFSDEEAFLPPLVRNTEQWPDAPEITAAPSLKSDFVQPSAEREIASTPDAQPALINPMIEVKEKKKLRLIGFSTSKQVATTVACLLFIIGLQTFVTSSRSASVKAESAAQQVAPEVPMVKPEEVSAAPKASPTPATVAPAPEAVPTPAPVVAVEQPQQQQPAPVPQPENQPAATQKGLYTLQVGAHQNIAEANAQAEKLRAAGFEPRVVEVEIPKRGLWYRVQVGNFGDRDEANRFGAQLRSKGVADNFIVSGL